VSGRWRSREPGSKHYEKESRPRKQSPKTYSTKPDPKLESRASKSHRVEKLKSWPAEATANEKAVKKSVRTKYTDDAHPLPRSGDLRSHQSESVQRSLEHQQSSRKIVAEEKSGTRVRKLSVETHALAPVPVVQTQSYVDMPPVQQRKAVLPLMDIKISEKYPRFATETTHARKVTSDRLLPKETYKVEQKPAAAVVEKMSHFKLDQEKTVMANKKVDKTAPSQLAISEADVPLEGLEKEKVEAPVTAAVAPSPTEPAAIPILLTVSELPAVPEPVAEKPSTVPVEMMDTNKTEEVLQPAASSEHRESSSTTELEKQNAPLHATTDKAAPQQAAAADKTEVSAKNVAQVKPLLVASVPEKSRWERETDVVSESHHFAVHAVRDRDRLSAAKTSLPR